MSTPGKKKRIAIVGGGPSGLFLYKKFTEAATARYSITIFESKDRLGCGMPYSFAGANSEHITNVSGNEIPDIVIPIVEWMKQQPAAALAKYGIDPANFTDYMVLPRLLFGDYLNAQFLLLQKAGIQKGLETIIHYNCHVTDVKCKEIDGRVTVFTESGQQEFDVVVICTGHTWPVSFEGKVDGYFDSPYPPAKLQMKLNHPVAIRGSSLTAIDAIRTIARHNGTFSELAPHKLIFKPHEDSPYFKIVMHSRQGLLPGIRFHLEDPHLSKTSLLTDEEIEKHIKESGGFLLLDYIFEKDFKNIFKENDPVFYERIKDMDIEAFVKDMMSLRENTDPFELFKEEYEEAAKSIRLHQSVHWKEALAILSFAMNYPAKHLSAEDMVRLQKVLMPLIAIVIAFVPQSSCEEMIALHAAGRLELVAVSGNNEITVQPGGGIIYHYEDALGQTQNAFYKTFIDSIGQKHLSVDDFPFKSLAEDNSITYACLPFRSPHAAKFMIENGDENIVKSNGGFYLKVPGIDITDQFSVIQKDGKVNSSVYIMAVPYIGGYNPDYSGLDFCEEASRIIVDDISRH